MFEVGKRKKVEGSLLRFDLEMSLRAGGWSANWHYNQMLACRRIVRIAGTQRPGSFVGANGADHEGHVLHKKTTLEHEYHVFVQVAVEESAFAEDELAAEENTSRVLFGDFARKQ
jgi:hypothetical protein